MSPANRTFYLASSMNLPGAPRGGGALPIAHKLVHAIEQATGDRCVSRWMYHKQQNQDPYLDLMAVVNLVDIAQADYVVVVPLTPTSRGVHVEMGMALSMGKPTYIYRPPGLDSLAFDGLCMPPPLSILSAIQTVLPPPPKADSGDVGSDE